VQGEPTVEIKERCPDCDGHGWLPAHAAKEGSSWVHESERTCARCRGEGHFKRDVPLGTFRELLERA
jgi:DnaJ-class molecular chaperone